LKDREGALSTYLPVAGLIPALVTESNAQTAKLLLTDGEEVILGLEQVKWARPHINDTSVGAAPKSVAQVLLPGQVVRLTRDDQGVYKLTQLPLVQGALVSMSPEDGAIEALVGGFNFNRSKFNRATQSMRQPGSSFKPFIYSAALERGFTTASIINDAPLVFQDPSLDKVWKPQNNDEKFGGPTRLREAMVTSRNLVSVRVLDAIGVSFARKYLHRFGFTMESLPENLSLALGTNAAPPVAMARGYAVFANGGFLVDPYDIDRIETIDGKIHFKTAAPVACRTCPERLELELQAQELAGQLAQLDSTDTPQGPGAATLTIAPSSTMASNGRPLAPRAIDERNAYIIWTMMRDVVRRGTASEAMKLGRQDLAGKTGTTNDHRDAWFNGFGPGHITSAWVGFDDFSSLGEGEFGAKAALPMWMEFMKTALEGVPDTQMMQPTGVTTARINPSNGLLTSAGDPNAIMEVFRVEDLGKLSYAGAAAAGDSKQDPYNVF
jgi:penicillin-binding protein 1A